jgi:hypothetical protein
MTGQELIILFKQDQAFLTAGKPLTLRQLGLPEIATTFKSPAIWTIRVLHHSEAERKLFCEIISYQTGETEFPDRQQKSSGQLSQIETISFRSIDTAGLLKTLAGPTPVTIYPAKYVAPDYTVMDDETEPLVRESIRQTIRETFVVPLKNVRFKLGGVSFDWKFAAINKSLELTIPNYDIREEFDAVKNYFANALKTRKIQVTATLELEDNKIVSITATSAEIDKIDKHLIDNVKFEFVKTTKRKKLPLETDKSLFTMDEYFDAFADETFKSNTFYNNDRELFEDLLTISDTKHYKHLRYLSSLHSHDIMKLRFIHKPFSFIFLVQGERNYHIIWETLDTEEATYVWHIAKDLQALKMMLRKIEDIINVIKVQGKTAYIHSTDDPFRRIYHDYSDLVDGFVKWKGELESILT